MVEKEKEKKPDIDVSETNKEATGKPTDEERRLLEPYILNINLEAWQRPGARIGLLSRLDYKSKGYRAGLIRLAFYLLIQEGTHFNVLNGGLVCKKCIKEELARRVKAASRDQKESIVEEFYQEAASELNSIIPKIRKPDGSFVRLYIVTSPTYDGEVGKQIADRLQSLRPDDIRHHEGGAKLEVKQPDPKKNKIVWAISPQKHRMPSKYHSAAAEREIDDKEGQTTQELPDHWIVGTLASSIHKPGYQPSGEREVPYTTLPAIHRLEEVVVAENQVGVHVVEYTPEGTRLVVNWNLKDLVAAERELIAGIKDGASDTHKKIVEVIKQSGAMTVGLLADALNIDRETIEREIGFLVEPRMLERKTWPGLYYNPSSQRYDFHLDWIKEKLQYRLPRDGWREDSILFFGCLHAGYNTTDYKYVAQEFPKIILGHNIKILAGIGDFIAGLQHSFMHAGEILQLNNTDQEIFAGELIATVIFKVFEKRFEDAFAEFLQSHPKEKISSEETGNLIKKALLLFYYIKGNHDLWQERDGNTSLVVFRGALLNCLLGAITSFLAARNLPAVNLLNILDKKIVELPDYQASALLPSGVSFELFHPHMARADTTSLRAQKSLTVSKAKVVGVANFHTAIAVHVWRPNRGQCVAAQTGTLVIFTPFEKRKLKRIDFGPVLLRVFSRKGKIWKTQTGFFNQPILKKPIPKWTDVEILKQKLGLLRTT